MTTSPEKLYPGRRILVTGHTGFCGAWLCAWLQEIGAKVTGLALPPKSPSLFEVARVGEGIHSILADIRDLESVRRAFARARPEIVFHLAAQSLVRRADAEPIETFGTNVLGTAHVFQAAREDGGVKALLNVTTDKCYLNREWRWGYRENDRLGGREPYGASKAGAELVGHAFHGAYAEEPEMPATASARAGNIVGGGDWAEDRLVPDIVRAIEADEPVTLRSPRAVRPWQHVLDCLAGYMTLASELTRGRFGGESFNFGPEGTKALTVREVTRRMLDAWGRDNPIEEHAESDQPLEAHLLWLDSTKAQQLLGWRPLLSPDETIGWTAAWYRGHAADPAGGRELLHEQLTEYRARLAP